MTMAKATAIALYCVDDSHWNVCTNWEKKGFLLKLNKRSIGIDNLHFSGTRIKYGYEHPLAKVIKLRYWANVQDRERKREGETKMCENNIYRDARYTDSILFCLSRCEIAMSSDSICRQSIASSYQHFSGIQQVYPVL